MTTHRPDSFSHYEPIAGSEGRLRVGVMAPLDEEGAIKLCDRWEKPFTQKNIEVVLIPVGTPDYKELLSKIDGLLLPGGHSMIHPSFYTPFPQDREESYDRDRDIYAMELIEAAYEIDLPALGICRGMQEMIVAFGGKLEVLPTDEIDHGTGYNYDGDHKAMDKPVHDIIVQPGGVLSKIFGAQATLSVNSIHRQGIRQENWPDFENDSPLGGLRIEALAPDGVVEGVSATAKKFFLGLQPHFEFEGPLHDALFDEFLKHIRSHHEIRTSRLETHTAPEPVE